MPPLFSASSKRRIIIGIDDHRDIVVVLRRRADHRRAADIDILDAVIEARALRHRRLERIKADHQKIDRL